MTMPANTSASGARPAEVCFTRCLHWPHVFSRTHAKSVHLLRGLTRSYFLLIIAGVYITHLYVLLTQACFASLVSQDYVNGTDQEEIRTGKISLFAHCVLVISKMSIVVFISVCLALHVSWNVSRE